MPSTQLPPHPNLLQYRKQAKDLLRAANSSDTTAIQRIASQRPSGKQTTPFARGARYALADAQLTIAREHGFESWPRFLKGAMCASPQDRELEIWASAQRALVSGDVTALSALFQDHAQMLREKEPPTFGKNGLRPNYTGANVQDIFVQNHEFETFRQFELFQEALHKTDSKAADFEAAADAVIRGDLASLGALLNRSPQLVRQRSMRKHHATLLHYVGANGVEFFRQVTPKNIVGVAEILLNAGADANASADMYGGGSTTLGLAATSIHPVRAGVQKPLMEVLLSRGADVGGPEAVNSCLANGRLSAAELLAKHGAPLDLEGACGVGRLDLVSEYFGADHSLTNGGTVEQRDRGFAWACEYGHTRVAEFLLDMGIAIGASIRNHGQTGLHWAAHCAHIGTAKALIKRGAEVNATDATWGATPLSWALHGWADPPPGTRRDRYYQMVKLLIGAGAAVEASWLERDNIRSDARMFAALGGAGVSGVRQ